MTTEDANQLYQELQHMRLPKNLWVPFVADVYIKSPDSFYWGQRKNGMNHGLGCQIRTLEILYGEFSDNELVKGKVISIGAVIEIYAGQFQNTKLYGHGSLQMYNYAGDKLADFQGTFANNMTSGEAKVTKWRDNGTKILYIHGSLLDTNFFHLDLHGIGVKEMYDEKEHMTQRAEGTWDSGTLVKGQIKYNNNCVDTYNGTDVVHRESTLYTGEMNLDLIYDGKGIQRDEKQNVIAQGTFKNGSLWHGVIYLYTLESVNRRAVYMVYGQAVSSTTECENRLKRLEESLQKIFHVLSRRSLV